VSSKQQDSAVSTGTTDSILSRDNIEANDNGSKSPNVGSLKRKRPQDNEDKHEYIAAKFGRFDLLPEKANEWKLPDELAKYMHARTQENILLTKI